MNNREDMIERAVVSLRKCENYSLENVTDSVRMLLNDIGFSTEEIRDKNVVIKPNLVRKMDIEAAGTTNPTVVEAVAKLCYSMGARSVTIAESPAGIYTDMSIRASYKAGRMDEASENSGAILNFDLSASRVPSRGTDKNRTFNIIDSIVKADIVVNVCKLKTHNLTGMSGAVKNFFGVIPGTEKLEMHALYPNLADFSAMICDLCKTVCSMCSVVNIVDSVIAMEGNGPTNGNPKKLGFIGASRDPFALDEVCSEIIAMKDKVSICEEARKRGFIDEIEFCGVSPSELVCDDFVLPDSSDKAHSGITVLSKLFGGKLMESLRPRPLIDKDKCIGCGECMRSCPAQTIIMKDKKAFIKKKDCIKCFCCQELCPKDAVKVKKNQLLALARFFT